MRTRLTLLAPQVACRETLKRKEKPACKSGKTIVWGAQAGTQSPAALSVQQPHATYLIKIEPAPRLTPAKPQASKKMRRPLLTVDSGTGIGFFNTGGATGATCATTSAAQQLSTCCARSDAVQSAARLLRALGQKGLQLQALSAQSFRSQCFTLATAKNYRRLLQLSITIRSAIDAIVATFCFGHGHLPLHSGCNTLSAYRNQRA